jgi:hypothetical protein
MFGQVWNHGTIRKYVIFFGTLFSEVYLQRDTAAGTTTQTIKVPLNYGPKEKFLARLEGDPELNKSIAMQLPRMTFVMGDMFYDPARKLASTGKMRRPDPDNTDQAQFQYNPVPYNFNFDLHIMVKNAEDGTRIIENILPFFTPEFTATLNLNSALGQQYDVPVILNSVVQQDSYEGNFEQRRAIIWTLSFTLKGYLFGPVRTSGVIKQAEINLRIPEVGVTAADATANTSDLAATITVTPGLTSAGEPTSNASLSIDKSLIVSTDDYGFITEFENGDY